LAVDRYLNTEIYFMLQTIINMISGLAGGNITGAAAKQINPGMIISSITGIVGVALAGAHVFSDELRRQDGPGNHYKRHFRLTCGRRDFDRYCGNY
jgi:hypothetical protein